MTRAGKVGRASVLTQTSATAAGNTVRATVTEVQGVSLVEADHLKIVVDTSQGMVGTSPTFNLFVQTAIKPNADPTVDDDWEDIAAFSQITTGTGEEDAHLPWGQNAVAPEVASLVHAVSRLALTAGSIKSGRWGDKLRFVEVIGGTGISQAAIYEISITAEIE